MRIAGVLTYYLVANDIQHGDIFILRINCEGRGVPKGNLFNSHGGSEKTRTKCG